MSLEVPQGSDLGPLLLILYLHTILYSLPFSKVIRFIGLLCNCRGRNTEKCPRFPEAVFDLGEFDIPWRLVIVKRSCFLYQLTIIQNY